MQRQRKYKLGLKSRNRLKKHYNSTMGNPLQEEERLKDNKQQK